MKFKTLVSSLRDVVPTLELPEHPVMEQEVRNLATNSHACQVGDVFVGMPGTRVDGGEFWPGAIAQGAMAAIVSTEALAKVPVSNGACVIAVPDVVDACARLAATFYQHPGTQLPLVGVTGTNGKTTTTHLIEFFLKQLGHPTALLGTLYNRWPGYDRVATHTTPFAVDLQRQLAQAIAAGSQFGVMEVSSHSLAQRRVQGCVYKVAVFTNLTQDHLDFHQDMENYFAAKALLFQPQYRQGKAVINWDDPYGQRLLELLSPEQVWSYSTHDDRADLYPTDLSYGALGVEGLLHTPQGTAPFRSPLVGQFNVANLLAAIGAGLALGLDLVRMLDALPQFSGVPGRMERVQISPTQDISVIVDYAHTPDSLENLLRSARPFISGRMICVFGCGGDRDRTKRPQMGKIVADLADGVVVTSDNPRTEDPDKILADILAGIPAEISPTVMVDRAMAIREAILTAQPGDGVLIAGKGHEDYQILGTEKVHFDDREQARQALSLRLA